MAHPLNDPFAVLGLPAMARPGPADLFFDIPVPDAGRRPGAAAVAAAERDVLDALHREFRQVLADPSQLVGRSPWLSLPTRPGEAAPGLDMLPADRAGAGRVLELLVPRESMDCFIGRFTADLGPLDATTLLTESRPEEVLQLFAEQAATQEGAGFAPLPSTTRRDHHALSPDSAVHIGAFAADHPKAER